MNSLLRTGSSWVRRTGIPGVTQTRSVSKQVIILGVPKHVTEQMVEHRARDYGDLNDVPTFRGKDVRNVNINFRELSRSATHG